jgi:hypothetical protein
MFYAWDITVPADTKEDNPVTKILQLSHGVISHVSIKFPSGCHGMVKVRLQKYDTNLLPLNRDDWITGDGETVSTAEYYELETRPYDIKLIACSPNTSYDHTITVRITVLPKIIVTFLPVYELLLGLVERIFGRGA